MMKEIDPSAAHAALNDGVGAIYLDVRTQEEFAAGHAPGAYNVPILELDVRGMMAVNQDFLRVVEAVFAKDVPIIVGCKSGQRSAQAADVLTRMGYTDVANLRGGFCGQAGFMGQVAAEGWIGAGLPVAHQPETGRTFAELAGHSRQT